MFLYFIPYSLWYYHFMITKLPQLPHYYINFTTTDITLDIDVNFNYKKIFVFCTNCPLFQTMMDIVASQFWNFIHNNIVILSIYIMWLFILIATKLTYSYPFNIIIKLVGMRFDFGQQLSCNVTLRVCCV